MAIKAIAIICLNYLRISTSQLLIKEDYYLLLHNYNKAMRMQRE
jgi:hypothetical protein